MLNPVDIPAVPAVANQSIFPFRFYPPGTRPWLVQAPKNRWKWVGDADLRLASGALVIQGRRYRAILPTVSQESRIPLPTICNVAQSTRSVQLQVKSEAGKPDSLQFWAADAEAAARIVSSLIRPTSARYMHAREVAWYEKENPDL